MNNKIIKIIPALLILFVIILSVNGCYYDNSQSLYPSAGVCDTSNITYSGTVQPLLQSQCYTCHTGNVGSVSGIDLTSYSNVLIYANNGMIKGCITAATGYPVMPQTGKMSNCNINVIIAWINKGATDN